MIGLEQFLKLFGDVTILNIAEMALACVFLYLIYKKAKDYLIQTHDAEKRRDEQFEEMRAAVGKYPEYRRQSIEIQQKLESEIQGLRKSQEDTTNRLMKMEEETKRRECNKLRDRLLQNYRYYTNKDTNPSQSWSKMEAEAFWELFRDYEDMGGNGYVHTEVLPAMERLMVVEVGE